MPLGGFQAVDDLLHVLCGFPAHGQHGVLGHNDHGVLQPDHGGQHAVAADVAVLGALQHHVAQCHVTGLILLAEFPQCRPAADVRPADIGRHHGGAVGRLGDRVVQADIGAGGELGLAEPDEVEVGAPRDYRCADGREHRGCMDLQFLQQRARGEHEHAGVPQMPARCHQLGGGGGVRLLDEAGQFMHAVMLGQSGADLDIAVADFG